MWRAVIVVVGLTATARGEVGVAALEPPSPGPVHAHPMRAAEVPVIVAAPAPERLRPQLQLDAGLSVIGPAYEQPIARHFAVHLEVFVFGTYFLPWFDAGDEVAGLGAGIRPTWFSRTNGRGLYVAPYFRVVAVGEGITSADGTGVATGVFVGWAFGLTDRLDLRIGGGAQYLHFDADTDAGRRSASTPFVALDAVVGYRL